MPPGRGTGPPRDAPGPGRGSRGCGGAREQRGGAPHCGLPGSAILSWVEGKEGGGDRCNVLLCHGQEPSSRKFCAGGLSKHFVPQGPKARLPGNFVPQGTKSSGGLQ